jgi:hypothetical protein
MIAGFPAPLIRKLMRKATAHLISLRTVTDVLECSERVGKSVLGDLTRHGFLQAASRWNNTRFEATMKGSALAQATAAKSLRKTTAKHLIADLVRRACQVNRNEEWAYRVDLLVIFGSCVSGAERPNDVDVACALVPRWSTERQKEGDESRRQLRTAPFRNVVEWAAWPKLEILKFLKSRSRGLSIQEMADWVLNDAPHVVVLRDGEAVPDWESHFG